MEFQKNMHLLTFHIHKIAMRNILTFMKNFKFINENGDLVPISRKLDDFDICFSSYSEMP